VQAHQHERLLRQEFGIAPDAEIAALIRQLQSEHPRILLEPRPEPVPVPPKRSGGIDQRGVKNLPLDIVPLRRRSATFWIFAASVVIAASAVLKGGSIDPIPPSLAAQTGGARDSVSQETYLTNLYVRGRNAEISRSEAGLATARQAYQLAIGRDSTFVLGYAGMAGIYSLLAEYGFAPRLAALDSARMMARRALVLDSTRSETRTAYAVTLGNAGDFTAAEREFKRATELNPRDSRAHYFYSVLLVALGRGEDAKREAERAEELDPLSPKTLAMRRHAHFLITGERPFLKLPPRERRAILKIEPNEPWALARQAEDLAQGGECADARSDIERAQRLAPNNVRMRPFMARVDWWCGDRARARALLDDMKRRSDVRDYAFDVALLHTQFAEKDSAFIWLERHDRWTVVELALLSASYHVDALRSDPRFLRLQRRLGVRH